MVGKDPNKRIKEGVRRFSWEKDAEATTKGDESSVLSGSEPSARSAPPEPEAPPARARISQTPTLETMFPIIGEKFPDILTPDGEMAELGKGLATTIGFESSFVPARDMVALAMYHSPLGKGKKGPQDLDPKDIDGMLYEVAEMLDSDFKFFQDVLKWPVYVDTGIIKVANKGAMGFMFYGLRSSKPSTDGLRPFDLVSKVEDLALGAGVVRTMYSMVKAHQLYREEALETAGDIVTNPAIRQQLLLTAYSMALPEIADAIESPSVGQYFSEHYLQHVKKFLNVHEGDTGFIASIVNTIEGYLLASVDEATEKAQKTIALIQDKEGAFANDLARMVKANVADLSKFSAAAARSSEILLFSNPMTTIHMGNAVVYDLAELSLQARFAGKRLEAGKLQSLYEGDK